MEGLRIDYQKLLKCTHCLKGFQDPILLPCLHSFCKECIKGSGGYIPKCPTCDDAFTEDDVKDDVKVQGLIKLMRDEHSPSVTLDYSMEYAPSAGMKVKQLVEAHGLYWMVMENGEVVVYNDQIEKEISVKYSARRESMESMILALWVFIVFMIAYILLNVFLINLVDGNKWFAGFIIVALTFFVLGAIWHYNYETKTKTFALIVTQFGELFAICTWFRTVYFVKITPPTDHSDAVDVHISSSNLASFWLQFIKWSSVSDISTHGSDVTWISTSEENFKAWRISAWFDLTKLETPTLVNDHKVDIKICSDEKSVYSISQNMLYRYKWDKAGPTKKWFNFTPYRSDVESSYRSPFQFDGDLIFHGATKGRILISHTVTNALNQQIYRQLYILNIASSTWTLLRIPDENGILVYAKLDAQNGVYALCRKAGGTGLRLFRLQIEDLDGKRAPQQEEPVEEAQGGGEQTTGPITMNFNKILAFGEGTCRQYMPDNPSMMAAIQDGQHVTSQGHMFPSFEDQQPGVVRRAKMTEFKEE